MVTKVRIAYLGFDELLGILFRGIFIFSRVTFEILELSSQAGEFTLKMLRLRISVYEK